jgi:RecB family endonuclease NucS
MTFYKVDTSQQKLEKLESISFADTQWQERKHLQPLLRDNPESIDPDLLIITDEFSNWEDSKRRVDLLALDADGNLVVIELKRVENAGHIELQAIRYAAMVSTMDFEAVVNAHEVFQTRSTKITFRVC